MMKVRFHPEMLADIATMNPDERAAFERLIERINTAAAEATSEADFSEALSRMGVGISVNRVNADDIPDKIITRMGTFPTEH